MKRLRVLKEIRSWSHVLPAIVVLLTGKQRYKPKIEWSDNSWVHNIFRFYEMIFWRRHGVRCEMTVHYDGRVAIHQAHTFEASCALLETAIRKALKFRLKIVKIYLPVLAVNTGYQMPSKQPYLFAIAFDATGSVSESTTTNPHTFSLTCTGSNRELIICSGQSGIGIPSSASYNSVSATNRTATNTGAGFERIFSLVAPATGSNTVSVNAGGTSGSFTHASIASSYTGVDQTTDIGATNTSTIPASCTISVTSTVANSMLVDLVYFSVVANTPSVDAGQTINGSVINSGASGDFKFGSSRKLTTSVGSYTMSWSGASATSTDNHVIEVLPLAVAGSGGSFLLNMI